MTRICTFPSWNGSITGSPFPKSDLKDMLHTYVSSYCFYTIIKTLLSHQHINIFPWAGMVWKWFIFQNSSCLLLVTKKSHIFSLSVLLEAQGMKEAWCDSWIGKNSAEVYENGAKGSQWKTIFTTSAMTTVQFLLSAFLKKETWKNKHIQEWKGTDDTWKHYVGTYT